MHATATPCPAPGRRAVARVLATFLLVAGVLGVSAPVASGRPELGTPQVTATQAVPQVTYGNSDSEGVRYIEFVYLHLLDRAPDTEGLNAWLSALFDQGVPRLTIANAITSSREYRARLITASYDRYLDRTPDLPGLETWLRAMDRGATVSRIESGFIASDEYYARAGGSDGAWVIQLYADVLGRSASSLEVVAWTEALHSGGTRQGVAMGFLLSTEHLTTVVQGYYQQLLGRGLDPTGQREWVNILQAGGRDEAIIGGIIASDEYYNRVTLPGQIGVSPSSSVISSGAAQPYSVEGFTTMGHSIGDVTMSATFVIEGDPAACLLASCSPLALGDHVVHVSVGLATTTVVLHVVPAAGPVLYSMHTWGSAMFGELGDGTWTPRMNPTMVGAETHWATARAGMHNLATKTDGTLWAWGFNRYGQIGDGTTTDRHVPVQVGADTHWASVAVGGLHSVALKTDGSLWAWGPSWNGQIGDGTTFSRSVPVRIGTATDWTAVAAGSTHTVALKADGTLWAWGDNAAGQLGDGTTEQRLAPVQVGTATDWAVVAAGRENTAAIKTDGTLWTWGKNDQGQLGDGTLTSRSTPAQVGTDSDWASVLTGTSTMAIKSGGTLWTWGDNTGYKLGRVGASTLVPGQVGADTDWASVTATFQSTVALKADGTMWHWGYPQGAATASTTPTRVGTQTGWALVSGDGGGHVVALRP